MLACILLDILEECSFMELCKKKLRREEEEREEAAISYSCLGF